MKIKILKLITQRKILKLNISKSILLVTAFFLFANSISMVLGQTEPLESKQSNPLDFQVPYGIDLLINIIIAIFLGLFFFYMSEKSGKKLSQIIENQNSMRERREKNAIYDLKNHFTTLLFTIGIINRLIIKINKHDEHKTRDQITEHELTLKHALEVIRNTLIYSSDVLEPELVTEINTVCQYIEENKIREEGEDKKLVYPKYSEIKKKIFKVSEELPQV